ADFFQGILTTALAEAEMLVAIRVPAARPRTGTCFREIARRHGDFAMMGVAAVVTLDVDGTCTAARIACCNAGVTPLLAEPVARVLVGERRTDALLDAAADAARHAVDPLGNVHASKDYQRHLAGVLTRRALATAFERAAA